MKNLRDDFHAYFRPDERTLQTAYTGGTIVLDANALLDLYRLSPSARADYLSLLSRVKDRLFIPYQVALEFHLHRADAVAGRRGEFEQALSELEDAKRKASAAVSRTALRSYGSPADASGIVSALDDAFVQAQSFISRAVEGYDLDANAIATSPNDSILELLEPIVMGRVNERPADDILLVDLNEAERRSRETLPPGYKDANKKQNPYGDYLWWAEVVRYMSTNPGPLLIVGNDVTKGDWTFESRGFKSDPHRSSTAR